MHTSCKTSRSAGGAVTDIFDLTSLRRRWPSISTLKMYRVAVWLVSTGGHARPNLQRALNYCDMANNLKPGLHGDCARLDILEINSQGAQTAITEMGGDWGSGRCDKNGCSRMIGGPIHALFWQRT